MPDDYREGQETAIPSLKQSSPLENWSYPKN